MGSVLFIYLFELTFSPQECIKLIKNESKNIYNDTKDKFFEEHLKSVSWLQQ